MRKAQMFVVTMVILTGLMFTVQQLLFQYSFLDLSEPMRDSDDCILRSISTSYSAALEKSETCEDALKALIEIDAFLGKQTFVGQDVKIEYNERDEPTLDCSEWGTGKTVLNLTIEIMSPLGSSEAEYFYSGGSPEPQPEECALNEKCLEPTPYYHTGEERCVECCEDSDCTGEGDWECAGFTCVPIGFI